MRKIDRSFIMRCAHEGKGFGLPFGRSQQLAWNAAALYKEMMDSAINQVDRIPHTLSWPKKRKMRLVDICLKYGPAFADEIANPRNKSGWAYLSGRSNEMPSPQKPQLFI